MIPSNVVIHHYNTTTVNMVLQFILQHLRLPQQLLLYLTQRHVLLLQLSHFTVQLSNSLQLSLPGKVNWSNNIVLKWSVSTGILLLRFCFFLSFSPVCTSPVPLYLQHKNINLVSINISHHSNCTEHDQQVDQCPPGERDLSNVCIWDQSQELNCHPSDTGVETELWLSVVRILHHFMKLVSHVVS